MNQRDKALLAEALKRICADVALLATMFEDEAAPETPDEPAAETPQAPEKVYTYEEVRAILAEKSRTGFRAEVKAICRKESHAHRGRCADSRTARDIVR